MLLVYSQGGDEKNINDWCIGPWADQLGGVKMRFLSICLLCLLCSPVALAQTQPVLQLKGEVVIGDQQESILVHKFLDSENRILLVGRKTIRIFDVTTAKFLEFRLLEIPDSVEDNPRVISPDGRRMLVFGNYGSRAKKDKVKRPASIWDLQTGKQIAVLDKTSKPVRAGFWSKNGKTLATSSDKYGLRAVYDGSVEISFWDGETFKYQSSLPASNVNWTYLSNDGAKCFYSVAPVRNFIIEKIVDNTGGPISVWDTSRGVIEKRISLSDGDVERKISGISISPDEKFLVFVAKKPKANEAARKLVVWEIDKSNYPEFEVKAKYEINPTPKIYEHGVTFSPDGKYFALDAGKNLQVYETQTGERRSELENVKENPGHWLNDNKVLLYKDTDRMKAIEMANGMILYEQLLIYRTVSYSDGSGSTDMMGFYVPAATYDKVVDYTRIVPHPNGRMFLTYSNQYVKVIDSQTGELLQAVVSPQMDYSKNKPSINYRDTVAEAGWSTDGKTLYVISLDNRTMSLWRLPEK